MSEPKEVTIHDVLDFIRDPNLDRNDRTLIVEALRAQTRDKREEQKAQFRRGQRVKFYDRQVARDRFGNIRKINRVNIDLIEEGTGRRWRVSPSLLNPA